MFHNYRLLSENTNKGIKVLYYIVRCNHNVRLLNRDVHVHVHVTWSAPAMAVIKRWLANTGPNTCYRDT